MRSTSLGLVEIGPRWCAGSAGSPGVSLAPMSEADTKLPTGNTHHCRQTPRATQATPAHSFRGPFRCDMRRIRPQKFPESAADGSRVRPGAPRCRSACPRPRTPRPGARRGRASARAQSRAARASSRERAERGDVVGDVAGVGVQLQAHGPGDLLGGAGQARGLVEATVVDGRVGPAHRVEEEGHGGRRVEVVVHGRDERRQHLVVGQRDGELGGRRGRRCRGARARRRRRWPRPRSPRWVTGSGPAARAAGRRAGRTGRRGR